MRPSEPHLLFIPVVPLTHHDQLFVLFLDVAAVEGALGAARVREEEARLADAQVRAASEAQPRDRSALKQWSSKRLPPVI